MKCTPLRRVSFITWSLVHEGNQRATLPLIKKTVLCGGCNTTCFGLPTPRCAAWQCAHQVFLRNRRNICMIWLGLWQVHWTYLHSLLHDPKCLSLYELFRSLSAYGEVSMCSSCLTQHSLTSSTHSTAAHYTTNYYFYILFLKYFITYFFFSLCMFSTCFSRAPAGWYCIKGTDECSDSCSRQELGLGKSAGIFYRSPYLSLFFISSFFVFILPPSFQSPCLYHLEQPN